MTSAQLAFFNPVMNAHQPGLQMFAPPASLPCSGCCDDNKMVDPRFGHVTCPCDSSVSSTTTPIRSSPSSMSQKDLCSPPSASLSLESSAFYPASLGMPVNMSESFKCLPTQSPGWTGSYDHSMVAPYFYHPGYLNGFDPNSAVRRKNATRETTSALKAWLFEHRKNPYPTKAEKIMLAIITRMTLTQVSTWFANARRRLKKEHKFWNSNDKDSFMADDDKEDENDSFDSETKEMTSAREISSFEKETGRMRKLSGSCSDGSYPETSDISDTELSDDVMEDNDKLIVVDDQTNPMDTASSSIMASNYFSDAVAAQSYKSAQNCSNSQSVHEDRLASSSPHANANASNTSQNTQKSPSSKPKIWSIANIIGESSSSSSSQSTVSSRVTSSSPSL